MCKYTNKTGLSSSLYDAIVGFASEYDKVGWKSVTTLIDSPRAKLLTERHSDEIIEDVSDLLWIFFGNMAHLIAERNASPKAIAEQRFIEEVNGKQISFKPDLLLPNEDIPGTWTLRDFKVTSVYALKSALNGNVKKEWTKQLNIYAYLLHLANIQVTAIKLEVIARDWRFTESLREHGYPAAQCAVIPVAMWSTAKTKEFLEERIRLFAECEELEDDDLPLCSEDERWADPDRWAVVKTNGKVGVSGYKKALPRATSFRNRSEALIFMAGRKDQDELEIEYRRGESRRCERGYCKAAPFCSQFRETIKPAF